MLLFAVCLEASAYLIYVFGVFNGIIVYPFGNMSDLSTIQGWFSLNAYSAILGIGGAALIGLAGLLLRQGVYAIYAMLIWAIGMFISIVKDVILVIPNTIAAIIPASANPLSSGPNPIQLVVGLFVIFAGFMYLFEMVIQRNVT
jgi:hypothetical protein